MLSPQFLGQLRFTSTDCVLAQNHTLQCRSLLSQGLGAKQILKACYTLFPVGTVVALHTVKLMPTPTYCCQIKMRLLKYILCQLLAVATANVWGMVLLPGRQPRLI